MSACRIRMLGASVVLARSTWHHKHCNCEHDDSHRLRILSFNIQWAARAAGRPEPMMPAARLAAASGADIVCVQEIQTSTKDAPASSPAVQVFGGDQPASMARVMSDLTGNKWLHAFGSNQPLSADHRRGPALFGNAVLWCVGSHVQIDSSTVFKMAGDLCTHISAHREGRCAIAVFDAKHDVAIVTVHLGFMDNGRKMLRQLLENLSGSPWANKTLVLCGDFNSYFEEGRNPNNDWEKAGRYLELMSDLQEFGFQKVAGCGSLVSPKDPGLSPYAGSIPGKGDLPCSSPQQACFVTFPYWTDQVTRYDSHDHQLDYFFIRPAKNTKTKVTQFVPVAAHGISDHHALLLELTL